jgi:hypothetical protein
MEFKKNCPSQAYPKKRKKFSSFVRTTLMLLHLAMSFQSYVGIESPGYEEKLMC